jgi:hypothetical protein
VLADQGSAGRPQAGDAEVVQRISGKSQIANVHAVILGFTQVHPLHEAICTQNTAVKNSGEYNWGAALALQSMPFRQSQLQCKTLLEKKFPSQTGIT